MTLRARPVRGPCLASPCTVGSGWSEATGRLRLGLWRPSHRDRAALSDCQCHWHCDSGKSGWVRRRSAAAASRHGHESGPGPGRGSHGDRDRHCHESQLGPLCQWPGPGRRQLWKLSSRNVLRFFRVCGLSEAALRGQPLQRLSYKERLRAEPRLRRSERLGNRMSDHESPRGPITCE